MPLARVRPRESGWARFHFPAASLPGLGAERRGGLRQRRLQRAGRNAPPARPRRQRLLVGARSPRLDRRPIRIRHHVSIAAASAQRPLWPRRRELRWAGPSSSIRRHSIGATTAASGCRLGTSSSSMRCTSARSTTGRAASPARSPTAIERLSHVAELGANAVQLMPLAEVPGNFSWGYNPSDIFAVESDYGGSAGLKAFVKAAHRLGLAVIIDVVYNHLRPERHRHLAVRRLARAGQGRHLLLQRLALVDALDGDRPARLRARRGAPVSARQRPLWLDEIHADGLRWDMTLFVRTVFGDGHDPGQSLPDGWSLMQWVNSEHRRALAVEDHHRRGPAGQSLADARYRTAGRGSTRNGRRTSCIRSGRR